MHVETSLNSFKLCLNIFTTILLLLKYWEVVEAVLPGMVSTSRLTWLNKCWENVETNVESVWSGLYQGTWITFDATEMRKATYKLGLISINTRTGTQIVSTEADLPTHLMLYPSCITWEFVKIKTKKEEKSESEHWGYLQYTWQLHWIVPKIKMALL